MLPCGRNQLTGTGKGEYMNRYYQKYFEDHVERHVPNKSGSGEHLEFTYTGYYYRQELSKTMQVLLRLCYAALFAAQVYFFAGAGMAVSPCNTSLSAVLFQSLTMLCLLWTAWILCFYVTAPRDMTVYKYKSTALQLKKALTILNISYACTFIAAVAAEFMEYGTELHMFDSCPVKYLLAMVLGLALLLAEKNMKYKKIRNAEKICRLRHPVHSRTSKIKEERV